MAPVGSTTYPSSAAQYDGNRHKEGVLGRTGRGVKRAGSATLHAVAAILGSLGFLAIAVLSAVAIAAGWRHRWTTCNDGGDGTAANPAYRVSTGWYQWDDNFTQGAHPRLNNGIGNASYILGLISVCFVGVSFLLAVFLLLAACTRRASRWVSAIQFPFGLAMLLVLIAYYAVTAIQTYMHAETVRNGNGCFPHPDWCWILAVIAAALWFYTTVVSCCFGGRRRPADHYDEEAGVAVVPMKEERRGWFGRKGAPTAAAAGVATPGDSAYTSPAPSAGTSESERRAPAFNAAAPVSGPFPASRPAERPVAPTAPVYPETTGSKYPSVRTRSAAADLPPEVATKRIGGLSGTSTGGGAFDGTAAGPGGAPLTSPFAAAADATDAQAAQPSKRSWWASR